MVAVDVGRLSPGLAGVAEQGINQDPLGKNKEEAGDTEDEVEEPVNTATESRHIPGQPPPRYERRNDEQEQGPGHRGTEEDAPKLLHETTPDGAKRRAPSAAPRAPYLGRLDALRSALRPRRFPVECRIARAFSGRVIVAGSSRGPRFHWVPNYPWRRAW